MCGTMRNYMKHLSKIGLAIIVAGVIATLTFTNGAKAEPQHHRESLPAVVIFAASEYYENGYPLTYLITLVSKGPNAPEVLPGMELGPTLEKLIAQGFEIRDSGGLRFTAIRK